MASVSLQVEVVTPQERVLSLEAQSAVVPGSEGDLGVLPDHAPLLTAVRAGQMFVEGTGGDQKLVVGHGFAEILPERVTVLVTRAKPIAEISLSEVQEQLLAATAELTGMSDKDPLYPGVKSRFDFLAACLEAVKK